eukprot:gene1929-1069_t
MINFTELDDSHKPSQQYVHSSTLSDFPILHRQIESHRNLKTKDFAQNISTNISDIRLQIDFEETEKRILLIGYNYEARIFEDIDELISHLKLKDNIKENLNNPYWIDLQNINENDLNELSKIYNFHELTIEDCLSKDSGEKYEKFQNYIYFVFTQLEKEDSFGGLDQLNILLFKNYVITIHKNPIDGFINVLKEIELYHEIDIEDIEKLELNEKEEFKEFIENVKTSRDLILNFETTKKEKSKEINIEMNDKPSRKWTKIPSSDWILYSILDSMVDEYLPMVDKLINEVETCGEKVFSVFDKDREEFLQQLGHARRDGSELRRILAPKRKIASYIVSKDFLFISKDIQAYFRDILDHIISALEKIEFSRDSLSQTHSNYLAKISIEISESSESTDKFMNILSLLAISMIPFGVISGLFGMNVQVPFQKFDR